MLTFKATEFLLTLRSVYKQIRTVTPEYLTFKVSPVVFQEYVSETETTAKVCLEKPAWSKYLLRDVRVKADENLRDLDTKIIEGRKEWES